MSAPHVLAPRLAVTSDNTTHSDVSALLAAKAAAAGGSSSSHGVVKPTLSVAFDAAAVVKPVPVPSPISRTAMDGLVAGGEPGGMSAEEARRCREALIADLELLQREFERFQQQQQPPAGAMDTAAERGAKVEFFLGYIARILRELAVAGPAQLKELEAQVQTTLLPLKGKVVAQLAAAAPASASSEAAPAAATGSGATTCMSCSTSTASLASAATSMHPQQPEPEQAVLAGDLMPKTAPIPLAAGTVRRDDSSFGTTSSEGSSSSSEEEAMAEEGAGAGLDELDMECFSLIMEEDAAAPAETAAVVGKKRGLEEAAGAGAVVVKPEPPAAGTEEAQAAAAVKRQRSMTFDGKQSREVEYQCSVCSESYVMATANNPWWALEQQACPKCNKLQIPRVDITLPANTMDYHPALLAEEGDDDDDDNEAGCGTGGAGAGAGSACFAGDDFSRVESVDGEEAGLGLGVGTAEEGEEEGATLSPQQAAQLLVLLAHARTCPGAHRSEAQAALCRTVKFLMLHVRDCDGKTLDGEACAFSWCRPCKVLLGHLVRCYEGDKCAICNPPAQDLPKPLADLHRQLQHHQLQQPQVTDETATASGSGSCCGGHGLGLGHGLVTRALSVSSTESAESAATTAPCTPSESACVSHQDLAAVASALEEGTAAAQQQQAVVGVAC